LNKLQNLFFLNNRIRSIWWKWKDISRCCKVTF